MNAHEQTPDPHTVVLHITPQELQRIIDARIEAHEIERHRSHIALLEPGTVEQLIKGLTPDADLGYGKQYLIRLLDEKGIYGLERFLDKALEAIDEEGKLDISRNFDPDERRLFEVMFLQGRSSNITPESIGRRQFMRKLGSIAAWSFIAEAAVPVAANLAGIEDDKPEEKMWRRALQKTNKCVHYAIAPIGLGAIGLHILNDMHVEDVRIRAENIAAKLSHIEWALDELVKAGKRLQRSDSQAITHTR